MSKATINAIESVGNVVFWIVVGVLRSLDLQQVLCEHQNTQGGGIAMIVKIKLRHLPKESFLR